jgi:NTE family protein
VLKVLEELHVPIDCIAGTSMGALVGGGYASGMTADEIATFVRNVDWKAVVGGAGSRARNRWSRSATTIAAAPSSSA